MSIPRGLCILGAKNYARTVIGDAQQAQPAHCEQEVGHKAGGQVRGEDRGAWRTTRLSGPYRANLQASGTAIINKKTAPLDWTLCSGTMTPSGPDPLPRTKGTPVHGPSCSARPVAGPLPKSWQWHTQLRPLPPPRRSTSASRTRRTRRPSRRRPARLRPWRQQPPLPPP